MFVIIRTLFYFALNMMNALCMLCFLLDVDNLRDSGALADGIIMSGCFDVCDVWRFRLVIESIRPMQLTWGKGGKRINHE